MRSGPYGRAWPPARPPRARRARLEEHRRRSAPGAGLPDGQGRQRPAQPVAAARAAAGPPRRRRSARPHRSESAQASYCPPSSTLRHQPPLAALAPAARRAAAAARGCLSWGQRLATRRGWGRTAPQLPASSPASSPSARQPRRARRGLRERSPARRRCRRSRPEPAPLPLRSGAPCLRHTARARLRRTPCCGPRRLERSAPGDCCCTARVGLAGLHGPRARRARRAWRLIQNLEPVAAGVGPPAALRQVARLACLEARRDAPQRGREQRQAGRARQALGGVRRGAFGGSVAGHAQGRAVGPAPARRRLLCSSSTSAALRTRCRRVGRARRPRCGPTSRIGRWGRPPACRAHWRPASARAVAPRGVRCWGTSGGRSALHRAPLTVHPVPGRLVTGRGPAEQTLCPWLARAACADAARAARPACRRRARRARQVQAARRAAGGARRAGARGGGRAALRLERGGRRRRPRWGPRRARAARARGPRAPAVVRAVEELGLLQLRGAGGRHRSGAGPASATRAQRLGQECCQCAGLHVPGLRVCHMRPAARVSTEWRIRQHHAVQRQVSTYAQA